MEQITPLRTRQLQHAIELDVDEADFTFTSPAERELWQQLVVEQERFVEKDDIVWLIDAA
ncbi:MAG: hypothetical protein HKN94_01135 [Acidimicrobiales bacterium]|nr:hypothetical protein [Acidimicrobiales bacterium]RZV47566.1 MAG: hypothetical protein EX269_04470 [Acidimicrobiales bacterium]